MTDEQLKEIIEDEEQSEVYRAAAEAMLMQNKIKRLEQENERLKGELEKRQQELMGECELRITIEEIRDRIEKENATLRKENAKLKCLALHGMVGYAVCKMNVAAEKYKDDEMSDFAVPTEFSKWHRKEIEWAKAYRKAKAELKEKK